LSEEYDFSLAISSSSTNRTG